MRDSRLCTRDEILRISLIVLVILEIVFAANVLSRDITINNEGWKNSYSVFGIIALEILITLSIVYVVINRRHRVKALVLISILLIRSSFGLYVDFRNINLDILRVSQIFLCIYPLLYYIIGDRQRGV